MLVSQLNVQALAAEVILMIIVIMMVAYSLINYIYYNFQEFYQAGLEDALGSHHHHHHHRRRHHGGSHHGWCHRHLQHQYPSLSHYPPQL